MPRLKRLTLGLQTLTLIICLAGCQTQKVRINPILHSSNCHINEEGLYILDNPTALHMFIEKSNRSALSNPHTHTPGPYERGIAIALGDQPTAGYSIELLNHEAIIEKDVLKLPIAFHSPDTGTLLAQVITSPCLVITLDSNVHYQKIEAGHLHKNLY